MYLKQRAVNFKIQKMRSLLDLGVPMQSFHAFIEKNEHNIIGLDKM